MTKKTTGRKDTEAIFTRKEIVGIISSAFIAIVLGCLGYTQYYQAIPLQVSILDILYDTLSLFVFQFNGQPGSVPWPLEIGRWLAPLSLSYTAVKTLIALLGERVDRWKVSWLRNHAVIYGLNERTQNSIKSFLAEGIPVVVVSVEDNNPMAGWVKKQGGYVFQGKALDLTHLDRCGIEKAKYLLGATNTDRLNIEILHRGCTMRQNTPHAPRLQAAAEIRNPALATSLYDHAIFTKDYRNFSARVINYLAMNGRFILQNHGPHREIRTLRSKKKPLKIMLLGDHDLLSYLVLRFATIGYYGNPPLRICMAGPGAEQCRNRLVGTNSVITQLLDLQALDIDLSLLNIESSKQLLDDFSPDLIYLCASQLESVLVWIQTLKKLSIKVPVICTCTSILTEHIMIEELRDDSHFTFYDMDQKSTHFETIFNARQDQLANKIHDNYVQQQTAQGESSKTNASLVSWDLLPENLKDSNRNQADHLDIKCTLLTNMEDYSAEDVRLKLTPESVEWLAKMEHDRWFAEKLLSGWRYTEGCKDNDLRLSPSLVPWNELPEIERQKDRDTVEHLPELVQQRDEVLR